MSRTSYKGLTMSDQHPEAAQAADKLIPGVWGSLREAWLKGYLGWTVQMAKVPRGTAYLVYYRKGREAKKLAEYLKKEAGK